MSVILAEKHTPEYLVHKYWARKPANVVRRLIEQNSAPGACVLDPFCGSGVTLVESLSTDRDAVGIDINPIAALLSRVLVGPVDYRLLSDVWASLISAWQEVCRDAYMLPDRRVADYCVHASELRCSECGMRVTGDELRKSRGRYACTGCGARLATNIAHSTGTKVIATYVAGTRASDDGVDEYETHQSNSVFCSPDQLKAFDTDLLVNKRILAYPGLRTSSLFTRRNFSLLANFMSRVDSLEVDVPTADVIRIAVTSAVASCSRLIAYRDNMKGGGPAWTVPGFWVPPVHLERNPLGHLENRFKKLLRGLSARRMSGGARRAEVYRDDAANRLRLLARDGARFDYIFADPPYGDSVPYLEFSQLWNCWISDNHVSFGDEIIVSDRENPRSRWKEYEDRLSETIGLFPSVMANGGRCTLSFNNLDIRAWTALLRAVQSAGLHCIDVVYAVPAVIPAKAQFSPSGSYVGDIYATFQYRPDAGRENRWKFVEERLRWLCEYRGGSFSRVIALRAAMLTILGDNCASDLIVQVDHHLEGLPAKSGPIPRAAPLVRDVTDVFRATMAQKAVLTEAELYAAVVNALPRWLGLDQYDVQAIATDAGLVVRNGKWQGATQQLNLLD